MDAKAERTTLQGELKDIHQMSESNKEVEQELLTKIKRLQKVHEEELMQLRKEHEQKVMCHILEKKLVKKTAKPSLFCQILMVKNCCCFCCLEIFHTCRSQELKLIFRNKLYKNINSVFYWINVHTSLDFLTFYAMCEYCSLFCISDSSSAGS